MSEQVIEIMEYISDKLGIVIDWTAENVYPYALDLIHRFTMVNIIEHSIKSVLLLVVFSFCLWAVKNCIFKNGRFYKEEYDEFMLLVALLPGVLATFALLLALDEIQLIINWVILPEMQIFNEIKMAGII